jgi:hypothetical protein
MNPTTIVPVDPSTWNKYTAYEGMKKLLINYCEKHEIELPSFHEIPKNSRQSQWNGYWRERKKGAEIHVNLIKSRPPTKNPGFAWSFPGWKADLTSVGILCHEFGHHIYYRHKDGNYLQERWENFFSGNDWKKESGITSYGNSEIAEDFAETAKVYFLNPDLLAYLWPKRYAILRETGILPLHTLTWQEVLKSAHEKYHKQVEKIRERLLVC